MPLIRRLEVGDLTEYGLPQPEEGVFARLMRLGVAPAIVDKVVIEAIKDRRIEIVAGVESLDGDGVALADGTRVEPEAVIAATGYRPAASSRWSGHLGVLDARGMPQPPDGDEAAPGLRFVGYLPRPAHLGLIAREATYVRPRRSRRGRRLAGVKVDVEYDERYWYPDDGGQVWIAGYQIVDRDSGRYLARDAPELAARGLRVAGVAGAGHTTPRRCSPTRSRRAARSSCAATRTTRTTPTRSRSTRATAATRSAGYRASWPPSWRRSWTPGGPGRPWCCASSAARRATRAHGLTMLLAPALGSSSRRSSRQRARHVQLDRLDLLLPVRPAVDRPGGADPVAGAGQGVGAQRPLHVDDR